MFKVIIENEPPYLAQGAPENAYVTIGGEIFITLGDLRDKENDK